MNYIVTLDNCGERHVYHIEEIEIYNKFDHEDVDQGEVARRTDEFVKRLVSLDGKVGGRGSLPQEDQDFIVTNFVKVGGFKPIDRAKGLLLSGYFKFIYIRWLN